MGQPQAPDAQTLVRIDYWREMANALLGGARHRGGSRLSRYYDTMTEYQGRDFSPARPSGDWGELAPRADHSASQFPASALHDY